MEETHELIEYQGRIPVNCFIQQLGHVVRHWHDSIELLYVLFGSINVIVNNQQYTLLEDDVLLVNSNEPHELSSDGCTLVKVQIKMDLFDKRLINEEDLFFNCNSTISENKDRFIGVKRIIAQLLNINLPKNNNSEINIMSLVYSLLFDLIANFKEDDSQIDKKPAKYSIKRMSKILRYINDNYCRDLSLAEIAHREHFSVPYLSKFFHKNMGMNYTSYINKLRMEAALRQLIYAEESVEKIAISNGFPNSRSFVRVFKREYGSLPSQYKNRSKKDELIPYNSALIDSSDKYAILDNNQMYIDKLAKYLPPTATPYIYQDNKSTVKSIIARQIDTNKNNLLLSHTFKTFTCVGMAKEVLNAEIQEMLTTIQDEIGFKYIKFHGLLNDNMLVCVKNENGNSIVDFAYVDKVFDFLTKIKLKPLVQLSYMPRVLALNPDKAILGQGSIASEPKDMAKWNNLIHKLTQHLLVRYGKEQVHQWKFSVWNGPDTPETMFGMSSQENFYDFYKNTFDTVKLCDEKISIGSPSSYYVINEKKNNWLVDFTEWCSKNNCMPDFINVNFYGMENYKHHKSSDVWNFRSWYKLSEDPDIFNKFVNEIRNFRVSYYGKTCNIFLSEWNYTPSHLDLLNDTCYRSCYIIKNILENYDRLDSFCVWSLTDFRESRPVPVNIFHGGLGIFTANGIKKPAFYALLLLNKLGSQLIERGDGYFVTREADKFQIILYNYKHYSTAYARGEVLDMTFTNRYSPFGMEEKGEYILKLVGVNADRYEVTEYIVNRRYGSCFDKWVEMGAIPLKTAEEIDILKALSKPMINKYELTALDNSINIFAVLDMLEVRYIEIKPIESN